LTILLANIDRDGEEMPLFTKKRPSKENHVLISEINRTKIALEAAYSNFENVIDPDLIDSCIYELNAIQNRYHFLLKQAKATEQRYC
jgi:exonuclease VII small subunit